MMARVFEGKIAIPGDQMDEYLEVCKASELAIKPFRQSLEKQNQAFGIFLAKKYSKKTVRKHTSIVALFIDFICGYTDVTDIHEITKGMVNSKFRSWYKRKVWDSATESDLRVALKKFFQFLDQEQGITNETALKALK